MKPRMFNGLIYGKLYGKPWFLAPNRGVSCRFSLQSILEYIIKQTYWRQGITYINILHIHKEYLDGKLLGIRGQEETLFLINMFIMEHRHTYFRPASKIAPLPFGTPVSSSHVDTMVIVPKTSGNCQNIWVFQTKKWLKQGRTHRSQTFIVNILVFMSSMQCTGSNASGMTIIRGPLGHWICGSPSFQVRASATSVVGQSLNSAPKFPMNSSSSRADLLAIQNSLIPSHSHIFILWVYGEYVRLVAHISWWLL